MRNFDLHQVLFDGNGNRFSGKIYFAERDGDVSNLKPIYNSNGELLENPIYSTNYGTTESQVFLESGDYSVWMYRYTGNGNMEDDEQNWEPLPFSPFIVTDVTTDISLSISSLALPQIPSIAELRRHGVDLPTTTDGKRIVALTGYNEAGDKGVSIYKYSSIGTDSDNGGSVISITGDTSHCWRLVNDDDYINVADFGFFPDSSATSQLSSVIAYANANGKSIKFNKGNYNIGSSFVVNSDIIADGATFTSTAGVSVTCRNFIGNASSLIGGSGKTLTLVSDYSKASWALNDYVVFAPRFKMILDKAYSKTLSNIIVEVDNGISYNASNFSNCTIITDADVISRKFQSGTGSYNTIIEGKHVKTSDSSTSYADINGRFIRSVNGSAQTTIDGGNINTNNVTANSVTTNTFSSDHIKDTATGIELDATTNVKKPATFQQQVTFNGATRFLNVNALSMKGYTTINDDVEIDNGGRNTYIIGGSGLQISDCTFIAAHPKYPTTISENDNYPRINLVGNFIDGSRLTILYFPTSKENATSYVDVFQRPTGYDTDVFLCRIAAGNDVTFKYSLSKHWSIFPRFI